MQLVFLIFVLFQISFYNRLFIISIFNLSNLSILLMILLIILVFQFIAIFYQGHLRIILTAIQLMLFLIDKDLFQLKFFDSQLHKLAFLLQV